MIRDARRAALLGAALSFGIAPIVGAQVIIGPGRTDRSNVDFGRMSARLEERTRFLVEEIAAEMGTTADGRHLLEDAEAVADAAGRLNRSSRDSRDPRGPAAAFNQFDASWRHLRSLLEGRRLPPSVGRAAERVDETAGALYDVLGPRVAPPAGAIPVGPSYGEFGDYGGPVQSPDALIWEAQQRAEALASAIHSEMADPLLTQQAAQLAAQISRLGQGFARDPGLGIDPRALDPIASVSEPIARRFASGRVPSEVTRAWDSYAYSEMMLRQQLGAGASGLDRRQSARPSFGTMSPAALELTDRLAGRLDEFLQVFSPTVRVVPEGEAFLAEAQALRNAVEEFREAARAGAGPRALAEPFGAMQDLAARLNRRVDRVGRGRSGPNIEALRQVGAMVSELGGLLEGRPVPYGPGLP